MPYYEHKCPECGPFEDFRRMADAAKLPNCPECGAKKCARVWIRDAQKALKVVGSGDTTTVITNDDHTPYRFKTGTEKEQRQEIAEVLNKREQAVPERFRRTVDVQSV